MFSSKKPQSGRDLDKLNKTVERFEDKVEDKLDHIEDKVEYTVEHIAQIDKKLWEVQKSTRTLFKMFQVPHEWLRSRSKLYYNWHLKPYSKGVHWGALALSIVLMIFMFGFQLGFFGGPKPAIHAAAGIPKMVNYQGKLTDANNIPVADGSYNFIIRIYDDESAGSCLWAWKGTCGTPTAVPVTVSNGIFSVLLGDTSYQTTNALSLDFNTDSYWLQVEVGGETLTPRKRVGAVGYAYNSDTVDGHDLDQDVLTSSDPQFNTVGINDTDDTHQLFFTWNEDESSSDRVLNLAVGGGDRTLSLSGNLTVESASLLNQDLTSDASPSFSELTLSGGTATLGSTSQLGDIVVYDGSSNTITLQAQAISANYVLTLPTTDGGSGEYLKSDGDGNLSWDTPAGGSGDITAVGSMTSGDAFADATADDDWLGLGSGAGRIEFDDQDTDEVNILGANVGIGTASPNELLTVAGTLSLSEQTSSDTATPNYGKIYAKQPSGDPGIDSYTKLMLHMDGTDGSTTFTDSEPTPTKTPTVYGSAQLDIDYKEFGTASGIFQGSDDYLKYADHVDWDWGTDDFTVDFWVRFNSINGPGIWNEFFDNGTYSSGVRCGLSGPNTLGVYIKGTLYSNTWDAQTGTWYHIAVVRYGTSIKIYVDGTAVVSDTNSSDISGLTAGFYIGDNTVTTQPLDGWIDEFRVSKGIARWASNFTRPTSPYTATNETYDLYYRNSQNTEKILSAWQQSANYEYVFYDDGDLGIGTSTPAYKLDVSDTGAITASERTLNVSNTQTSSTASVNIYGGYFATSGNNDGASATSTGLYAAATGTSTTNHGIYATASGASTNYAGYFSGNVYTAGNLQVVSTNATGTTTSSSLSVSANSLTSGTGLYIASSSLTSGSLVNLAVSGTAAASNTQTALNISTSGANATSTQTTYGSYITNTHTGTASTNIAGYFSASGATTNYGVLVDAGDAIFDEDLVVGGSTSRTSTLSNGDFTLGGDDLFVAGMAGIEGNVYTDGSFIAGATTTYSDGSITGSAALSVNSGGTSALTLDSASGNLTLGAGTNTIVNTDATTDLVLKPTGNINLAPDSETDDYIAISSDGTDLTLSTVGASDLYIQPTGDKLVFQNSVDATTGIQFLDADGGTPILNVDTTNEYVGIGTATPNEKLTVEGNVSLLESTSTPSATASYGKMYASEESGVDTYTKLMLHADGVDTSTTFIDSSESNYTITVGGNAQLDTAQKEFGTASGLFDGTGDYITAPDNDDWNFAAGNFTIDCWVRFNSIAVTQSLFGQKNAGGYSPVMLLYNNATGKLNLYTSVTGAAWSINAFAGTKADFATDTWYHIAVVRNGDDYVVYVDGTADISTTQAGTLFDSTAVFAVGANGTNSNYLNGWLDEFRVSKGIARWTTGFTPPTIAYTSAGLNYIDSSGRVYSVFGAGYNSIWSQNGNDLYYSSGNVGIGQATPAAHLEVEIGSTDGVTGLLIDADDTDQIAMQIQGAQIDADIIDISADAVTTANVFDVTADALTSGSILNLVSDSADTTARNIVQITNDNTAATGAVPLSIQNDSTGKTAFYDHNISTTTAGTYKSIHLDYDATGDVSSGTDTNTGFDLDVTRTGASGGTINTIGLDIDVVGDSGGTSTATGLTVDVSGADTNYAALFNGGNVGIGTAAPNELLTIEGNISLLESTSTPSLTATYGKMYASEESGVDSYTKLMLHADGVDASTTFVDSSESNYTVTAYGNAQLDTAQKEFGTASGLFDGTGDYVSAPDTDDWSFGTGNFTIDFWVRFNDKTNQMIFASQYEGATYWNIQKFSNANGNKLAMTFYAAGANKGDYVMTNNWTAANDTWYHLAFVRNGTTGLIFIDGVSQTLTESTAFGANDVGNSGAPLLVNAWTTAPLYTLNGWTDEFRVSKGIARWTTGFTPPTIAYTSAGLNYIDSSGRVYSVFGAGYNSIWSQNGNDLYYSSGNVGIGQATPAAHLEVEIGSTDGVTGLLIDADDTDQIAMQIQGAQIDADIIDISADAVTTANVFDISATALTSGVGIKLTGPTSTGITGSGISIVSDVGSAGELINLAPDFSGSAVTGYGIYQAGTDSTANANTDYGYYSSLALSGNAAKTGYGIYDTVITSSTTADTLYSGYFTASATGAISSGTRNVYGVYGNPASTGASSGTQTLNLYGGYFAPSSTLATAGTTNVYGQYISSTATHNADAGTINQYGLYVADGTSSTNGTSTKYGLYVAAPTGADSNYGAYFGGDVGIGTTTPSYSLDVTQSNDFITGLFTNSYAPDAGGERFGVYGLTNGAGSSGGTITNIGVGGYASNGEDYNIGTKGSATGATTNWGVYGVASGDTGTKYGVYGTASGTGTNYAGYFVGNGYFSGNLGIGDATPDYNLDAETSTSVHAGYFLNSYNPDDINTHGIYAEATGGTGATSSYATYGVRAVARSLTRDNVGISGAATGDTPEGFKNIGVYGVASGADTNYAGYFSGNVYVSLNVDAGSYSEHHTYKESIAEQSGLKKGEMVYIFGEGVEIPRENVTEDENGQKKIELEYTGIKSPKVSRSEKAYDHRVVGVIACDDNPNETTIAGEKTKVVSSGAYPTLVDASYGAIKPGDPIASSDHAGYGMKATKAGSIMGFALESLNSGTGMISVWFSLSWYDPAINDEGLQGSESITANTIYSTENQDLIIESGSGKTKIIGQLIVTDKVTFENDIEIKGHIIGNHDTRGVVKIPAGETEGEFAFDTPYLLDPSVVASPITKGVLYYLKIERDKFKVKLEEPADIDLEFSWMAEQ